MLRAAGALAPWVLTLSLSGCYYDYSEAEQDGGGLDGSPRDGDGGGGDDADAAAPDAAVTPLEPVPFGPFDALSESGLYTSIASKSVRADVFEFRPEFALWTDRAKKTRWLWLPPGTQIGTANMGSWRFPVGTTLWKEFRDPDTDKRLETRIIQRLPNDACAQGLCFYFASFIWNGDDTEAYFDPTRADEPPVDIPAGCSQCDSPPCASYPDSCHVVPQATGSNGNNGGACNRCHGGEAHKVLGASAVQLSHSGPGLTLTELVALDKLSNPPPDGVTYPVPGTPVERAAVGYLHANCGHCHFSTAGQQACFALTSFEARVRPEDDAVIDTLVYQTGVDQDLAYWVGTMEGNHTDPLITKRIKSGDPQSSAVWYRMSVREWGQLPPEDDHQQMPTLGSHEVDPEGLGAVATWISALP